MEPRAPPRGTGSAGAAGPLGPPAPGSGGAAGTIVFPSPDASVAPFDAGVDIRIAPSDAAAALDVGPPSAYCDSMPKRPLPYAIGTDFSLPIAFNETETLEFFLKLDCNQTSFPDVEAADAGTADVGAAPDAAGGPGTPWDGGTFAPGVCMAMRYDPDGCGPSYPNFTGSCSVAVAITPSYAVGRMQAPGICIAPGARAVHFKARSSREGARVRFGSIREGVGSTEFYINLTTVWADYTVSIPTGEDYDHESPAGGVWDGFSIAFEPQDHVGGTYVFVSDVVWAAQ